MPPEPEWLPLTERQAACLGAVVGYMVRHGYAPSVRDLMAHLGYASTSGVAHLLGQLVKKGYLERDEGVARGLRLAHLPEREEAG